MSHRPAQDQVIYPQHLIDLARTIAPDDAVLLQNLVLHQSWPVTDHLREKIAAAKRSFGYHDAVALIEGGREARKVRGRRAHIAQLEGLLESIREVQLRFRLQQRRSSAAPPLRLVQSV